MPTQVVNTPLNSPFSIVVIDGIRLPTYAAGGVNISVGELGFVQHGAVLANVAASGAGMLTQLYNAFVASGSGNILTIKAFSGSGTELGAVGISGQPLAVIAFGPGR